MLFETEDLLAEVCVFMRGRAGPAEARVLYERQKLIGRERVAL